jgi:hypothetical protein
MQVCVCVGGGQALRAGGTVPEKVELKWPRGSRSITAMPQQA